MFDVFIREAAARFGLGDKALPLVQILLAGMTNASTGGLAGFLDKFKAAGLGPVVQSWLGGGPAAQPIQNSQIEAVLGASDGLLAQITGALDTDRDSTTSALGYLLPAIVGSLTPGGSLPASLPGDVTNLAAAGNIALSNAAASAREAAANSGSMGKWLPWVILVAVLLAMAYFAQNRVGQNSAAPASAPVISASEPAAALASDAASAAQTAAPEAVPSGSAAATEPASR
ncbi:MAG: YidB family protein [Burkholderiaceae bacterium]|jgi:uncharacterized protein YidB (DUF937 family)|nr:YidB family protein [Burkholderiaceae bacterium]